MTAAPAESARGGLQRLCQMPGTKQIGREAEIESFRSCPRFVEQDPDVVHENVDGAVRGNRCGEVAVCRNGGQIECTGADGAG